MWQRWFSDDPAMQPLLAAMQWKMATIKALQLAEHVAAPLFSILSSLATLQTEVVAQEVQPSKLTVWQRWSSVGRQLVERDVKGQVIQVGMIAGVVFMRTLLQVGRCIQTWGPGHWGRQTLAESVEAAAGSPLLMEATLHWQGMEVKHGSASCAAEAGLPLLTVQQRQGCQAQGALLAAACLLLGQHSSLHLGIILSGPRTQ